MYILKIIVTVIICYPTSIIADISDIIIIASSILDYVIMLSDIRLLHIDGISKQITS